MARARLPRINERVAMRSEGVDLWENTVVQDVRGDRMAVMTPRSFGPGRRVRRGQRYVIRYSDETREYRFTAPVLEVQDRPMSLTWLQLPDRIEQVQKRQYVRLDVQLPVRIRVESREEALHPDSGTGPASDAGAGDASRPDDRVLRAVTVDISAGGVQLRLEDPLPRGMFYRVEIDLPDDPVVMRAQIVRSTVRELPDGRTHRLYGLKFVGARTRDEDRIVRFIFAEQARRRRQGLA